MIKHFIGPAQATEKPVFLAAYFTSNDDNNDTVNEINAMDLQISNKIRTELRQHNVFIRTLKSNIEQFPDEQTLNFRMQTATGQIAPAALYTF